eukprot:gene10004-biopygen18260
MATIRLPVRLLVRIQYGCQYGYNTTTLNQLPQGSQDTGAGVARAWRGRGADYRPFCGLGGAGVARAWRGRGAGMSCDPREYRCSIAEVHKRRAPTRGGERALNPGNAAGRCILECVK